MRNAFFIFCICMVACTSVHQYDEANTIISFSSDNPDRQDSLFDVRYIKLETNDNCLLKTMGQMGMVSDSLLLVLDIGNKLLYAFNQDGKYLCCIGAKGGGPGEYLIPTSFFIDKSRKSVGIIDIGRQKVIYYRMNNLLYQSETDLPFETTCCAVAENGNMLWNSTGYASGSIGDNYFVLTDKDFKVVQTAADKLFKSGYQMGDSRNVYALGGKTYAYSPFDLSLWEKGADSIKKVVRFDLDNHSAPPVSFLMEKSEGGSKPYFSELENSDYVSYYTIREFADYYCVLYIVNNERFIGFFDKMTGRSYLFTIKELQKYLDTGKMNYLLSGFLNEYSVFPLMVSDLLEEKSQGVFFHKKLESLLQNASPDDNPILMCVRLK